MSWERVSKANPCPACDRDSWCMISDDGKYAWCMRTPSSNVRLFKNGDTGYIHRIGGEIQRPMPVRQERKVPRLDTATLESMLNEAIHHTTPEQMRLLSKQLGVAISAMLELRVSFGKWTEWKDRRRIDYAAWWFPMRNGEGALVGFRARDWKGGKWTVTGSSNGLYWPFCEPESTVYICEGASDVLAARSIGLFSIGRFSCNGGVNDLNAAIKKLSIRRAVIIADNDEDKLRPDGSKYNPGIDGAESLAQRLQVPCCVIALPCKDVREAVRSGMDAEVFESVAHAAVWYRK